MREPKYYKDAQGVIFMSIGGFDDLEEVTKEEYEEYVIEIERKSAVDKGRAEYSNRVVSLIRARYSLDDELALSRQRDIKTEQFEEYFAYCEYCKQRAKEEKENADD